MRYEDEWVSRTPIVRPPVGVQLLVPVAAEFLATEGDLEAILSLGFVTAAAESAAVSTNATTLRRLVGSARARMQGRHAKLDTRHLTLDSRQSTVDTQHNTQHSTLDAMHRSHYIEHRTHDT